MKKTNRAELRRIEGGVYWPGKGCTRPTFEPKTGTPPTWPPDLDPKENPFRAA